jgi:hypothetical protein
VPYHVPSFSLDPPRYANHLVLAVLYLVSCIVHSHNQKDDHFTLKIDHVEKGDSHERQMDIVHIIS